MLRYCIVLMFIGWANAQYTFPDGFQFGVATASYQVEGGWNANGKGENIWDRLTHTRPDMIADRSNGDVACDTYNKGIEDVQLLNNIGVNFYRFSISWSRILPSGHANQINPDGIRYYNELIDELLANGITPFVTMYHWDLPQPLEDNGGFLNEGLLVDAFEGYANVLYENFGDRVKDWITFNEPIQICGAGYAGVSKAPALGMEGIGGYICAHSLLKAHARAYRLYDEQYRASQGGRVGITIDSGWKEPNTDSAEDIEASELSMQVEFGWYAHPIFSEKGDYPAAMKERIARLSSEEGFEQSRLPEFTQEEIAYIRGTSDFFGLNHYTTGMCMPIPEGWGDRPSNWVDAGALCLQDESWESSASSWLKVVPWGFRKLLNWIKNEYNNPEVIVTENGFSDHGEINDCRRVNYYNSYLEQLLLAIYEDGCNISGYTAWSFMDNFEWLMGYTEKFGLTYVDFNDPERPRTPKLSSYVFSNIIATRRIDWDYTPEGFGQCQW